MDSAVHAELLTFKKGILVVVPSRWASNHSFLFESDSQSVVSWVAAPSSAPWQFQHILQKCCHVLGLSIEWSTRHIEHTRNDAIDVLARLGSSGMSFIEFGQVCFVVCFSVGFVVWFCFWRLLINCFSFIYFLKNVVLCLRNIGLFCIILDCSFF